MLACSVPTFHPIRAACVPATASWTEELRSSFWGEPRDECAEVVVKVQDEEIRMLGYSTDGQGRGPRAEASAEVEVEGTGVPKGAPSDVD